MNGQPANDKLDSNEQIINFNLPDIGEGIVECEVVEWQVSEGDYIEEDQRVADVSTDKALVEITSMYTGRIVKLFYEQGESAKVHSPMFAIAVSGTQTDTLPEQAQTPPKQAGNNDISDSAQTAKPEQQTNQKILTTPAVRRLARENNLDLSLVTSTGKNGRVLKEDALKYLQKRDSGGDLETSLPHANDTTHADSPRVEPIKGIRAVMAKAMMESVSSIPHFTYVDEIDMSHLIALRLQLKETYAEQGIRLTMMPFFMKALSLTIKQFPILNSQANADFTQLHYNDSHNIGLAVDSPSGLLVPNVKGVEHLSIVDIAQESNRLIDLARSGRIGPNELKGGTITISNVGAVGGIAATPIINKPEVAIVALGKVQTLPRFDAAGNVTAQQIMTVSWSGDHRVIDGATMARFNNTWKDYLENPSSMLMVMN